MRLYSFRLAFSILAVVGSLDIGFSFANAKPSSASPLSSSATTTHYRFHGTSSPALSFLPRTSSFEITTTNKIMSTMRKRPAAAVAASNDKNAELSAASASSALGVSGGATTAAGKDTPSYRKMLVFLTSLWGSGGVIYILAKAIKRVVPIALEPFSEGAVPLSQVQLGIYIGTCLWFAYVEGYKGFQTKFSPLVVRRSLTLQPGQSGIHHMILAPFYSMGLFHATKKRKIVSWSVTIGVAAIVAAVKQMPYPWRNIIDAGVVAGLSWGSLSIILLYLKAWIMDKPPTIDPALPE